MLLQLLIVLVAIIIGARIGGIGLGRLGGFGLAVLTFIFGLQPTTPPIDVMLMIMAVIAGASCMQAAGGLNLMVEWAEKLLRKNPSKITILSPLVTYFFTFIAGTGHVAYSVLPVIAEVATETKVRPERPLGIAVIASQQAITASPISAATVALLSMLAGYNISLMDILLIGALIGLARATEGNEELISSSTIDILFKSLQNIENNNTTNLLEEIEKEKKKLIPLCYSCQTNCGRNDAYDFNIVINNENNISKLKLEILNQIVKISKTNNKNTYTYTLLFNSLFILGIDNINEDYLLPTLNKLKKY